MTALHIVLGVGVVVVNLAAGLLGAYKWRRDEYSHAFWPLLRAGQALVAIEVIQGGVLLLLVCFANDARTLRVVRKTERFGVNVLGVSQEALARRFAASDLPEAEKFTGVPHDLHDGIPVLSDSLAWVRCALTQLVPGGDHTIGIGAVQAAETGGRTDPLVWFRGAYGGLA